MEQFLKAFPKVKKSWFSTNLWELYISYIQFSTTKYRRITGKRQSFEPYIVEYAGKNKTRNRSILDVTL